MGIVMNHLWGVRWRGIGGLVSIGMADSCGMAFIWERPRHVEEYYLPRIIRKLHGGVVKAPFEDAVTSTPDT